MYELTLSSETASARARVHAPAHTHGHTHARTRARTHMYTHTHTRIHAQLELIYTVENDSDSFTSWRLPSGEFVKERTLPNSLLILEAEGAEHGVSTLTRGERSIIKAIFTDTQEQLPACAEYLAKRGYSRVSSRRREGRSRKR